MKKKVLGIVGPTASGKTALSIALGKQHTGEVISADSRQIYQGFDVTTVVATPEEMQGVPHHLIASLPITERLSVAEYKKRAEVILHDITTRGNLPILCGGTGYYVDSILYDRNFPEVTENVSLREELEQLSASELFMRLQKLDPRRAITIEQKNPRRLIRAIEIATELGAVPETSLSYESTYDVLLIGLRPDIETLRERIAKRITTRLDSLLAEMREAYESGHLTKERAVELGFDFSLTLDHILGKMDKEELAERLLHKEYQFAKRQLRWFKRNPHIHWFEFPTDPEIFSLVSSWRNN